MEANAPGVTWSDPIKNTDASGDHHFVGTVKEEITNYAEVDSLCKVFGIWTVADDVALTLSKKQDTKDIKAGLGQTLSECEQRYGQPTAKVEQDAGGKLFYKFATTGYEIGVDILNGTVSRVIYHSYAGFDLSGVQTLLESNAPEAKWGAPYRNHSNDGNSFQGTVNGEVAYFANVGDDNGVLVIWTNADNDSVNPAHEQEASHR